MTTPDTHQSGKSGIYYGYTIVGVSFLIMMATLGTHFAYGLFFKPILSDFGWTRATVSGAYSLVWIIQGIMGILAGSLNDRFGARPVVTVSGIFLGAGYILMSQVSQVWHVYLFYGLFIGIGLSSGIPLLSTVVRWFTRRRSLMAGILVTGSSVGALIGPPIANWLISAYDWRNAYIIMGSVSVAIVLIAAQFLKRAPTDTVVGGKTANEEEKDGYKVPPEGFSLAKAIHTSQFWLIYLLFFCFGYCVYAVQVHIAPHITDIGISSTSAANVLAVAGATGIAGRIGLGSLGDRIGNKNAFAISYVLILLALIWLLPAGEVWKFYIFAILFGAAFGNGIANQSPMVAAFFGMRSHGILLGFLGMGYTFGAAIGPTVLGYMYDIAGNYHTAFIVTIGVASAGLAATLLLKQNK